MADKAHRLTDEKLEEMEKRLSAIYSRAEKTVQKKMADYAKSIDKKSTELLQAYKDAETIPEWEQPDSTNPYSKGDKVTHNGKTWMSDIDNNVLEPGVYGWTEAST